jgi:hypothetical protein
MSAYIITRTAVRFIVGMALCAVVLFGPGLVVNAVFGGAL